MLGAIGDIAFSSEPPVALTVGKGNAVLRYEDMSASIVTVTAAAVVEGVRYAARQTVAKQQALDLAPPPAPTGLVATGHPATITLAWNAAPANYSNLSHTEVWRAPVNNFAQAVLAGRADGREYTDPVGPGAFRYYWIRHVSRAAIPGPYNASSGTVGASDAEVGHLLQVLTKQITESQLYADLGAKIDLIEPTRDAVADLEQVYGDTVNAATSAGAAAQSASAAVAASVAADLAKAAANNAAGGAGQYAAQSAQSATNASTSAGTASTAAQQSAQSATNANGSASAAASSASTAAGAAGAAGQSANAASTSQAAAAGSVTTAGAAATASNEAKLSAQAARDAAGTARDAAGVSASAALISSNVATAAATAAGDSASAASQSAITANTRAGAASASAGSAATSETNAGSSASAAAQSAQLAAQSRDAAGGAASAAAGSASTANAKSTAAEQSAASASAAAVTANSASAAAAQSAGDAGYVAGQAGLAAQNAGGSAAAAAQSASSANTKSTEAAQSATAANSARTAAEAAYGQAQGAAHAASGSASTADARATAAGQSATAANSAATTASTSAGEAGFYATQAASSKTAADGSAASAASSLQQVQAIYRADLTNLCQDPTFAKGASNWNHTGIIALAGGGDGVWPFANCALVTGRNSTQIAPQVLVSPGDTHYFSAWVCSQSGAAPTFSVGVYFTGSNDYQSVVAAATCTAAQSNYVWIRITGSVTVPAGARTANLWMGLGSDAAIYWAVTGIEWRPSQVVQALTAVVNTEIQTRADQYTATSRRVDSVQASIEGPDGLAGKYAAVKITADATATALGKVQAKYGVQLDADGVSGGFELLAGGGRLDFGVRAGTFFIAAPAGSGIASSLPFIVRTTETVIGGVTIPIGMYVADAFIQNASITNAKIGGDIWSSNFVAGQSGWRLYRSGDLEISNLRARGNIAGGAFQSGLWPENGGTGFWLGADAFRMGNFNTGQYFEVTAAGNFSMPGLRVSGGNATFDGALSGATGTFAGNLSAASGTLGTITAGYLRNTANTTYVDLNATGGQTFLYAGGGKIRLTADGSGEFARAIISPPNVVQKGTEPLSVGWRDNTMPFTVYIDTGEAFSDLWYIAPSATYIGNATLTGGLARSGGLSGYVETTIVVGGGLYTGAQTPIGQQIYLRVTWTPGDGSGSINPAAIAWKLVKV
ncbi:hypothetical protein CD932_22405 [Janthinobacterium sp. PC23-8]|nr:hypothetical protein CD932_22405 [Janthinobacterium sp. PC23-8]